MQKIDASNLLNANILILKERQNIEWEVLKRDIKIIQNNMKPLSLVKSVFNELKSASDIKSEIVNSGIGLTAGYIGRKILWVSSRNPLVNILGTILQIGITNVVSKHPGVIKSLGLNIFKNIFASRKTDSLQKNG